MIAQACLLKRSCSGFKQANSDSSMVKFMYKNRTPVSTLKIVGSHSSSSSPISSSLDIRPWEDMCPYTFIESVLFGDQSPQDENVCNNQPMKQMKMQSLHATEFLNHTPKQITAYNNGTIAAVHSSNLFALRQLHADGQTLWCCNRFGKLLLHVACRRSNSKVVSFLLQ